MINRKAVMSLTQIFLLIGMAFAVSYIIYESDRVEGAGTLSSPSVCCEKTDSGAFCINTDEASCDDSLKVAPTSCETTSYCKLGTCYDSSEGICMENTPQRVCQEAGGAWDARDASDVPQCQLGCCIIADQAAFVPLVRCKRLSTLFGVGNDYRTDITDEVSCIAEAQSRDVGACVYEQDFERTCKFTTRTDCGAAQVVEAVNGTNVTLSGEKKFYKDYLCSAEELSTSCARQTSTNCYGGKVYWYDSCGNRENVYSSDRDVSWNSGRVVKDASNICSANDGSDENCGNCDYLLGSRCDEWDGILGIGKPDGSDYYCESTECIDRDGNERMNGESWCIYDGSTGKATDPVGSLHYKEVCVDGDVRVEPCADFRQEVCYQGTIKTDEGDFETAACRENRWQRCSSIDDEDDCLNVDMRDCLWLPPITGLMFGGGVGGGFSNPTTGEFSNPVGTDGGEDGGEEGDFSNPAGSVVAPITGNFLAGLFGGGGDDEGAGNETVTNRPDGVCVADFPPGLEFWEDGEAASHCAAAEAKCIVKYEKRKLGAKKCVENCECLEEDWAVAMNGVCKGLGDCGGYVNYVGKYTDDGYEWTVNGTEKEFSPSAVDQIASESEGGSKSGSLSLTFGTAALVTGGLGLVGVALGGKLGASAGPSMLNILGTGPTKLPLLGKAVNLNANWLSSAAFNALAIGGIAFLGAKLLGLKNANVIGVAAMAGMFAGRAVGQWAAKYGAKAFGTGAEAVSNFGLKGSSSVSTIISKGELASQGWEVSSIPKGLGNIAGNPTAMATNAEGNTIFLTGGGGKLGPYSVVSGGQNGPLAQYSGAINIGVAIGVALLVYYLLAKDESYEVVEFKCSPWQAPVGGNECEKCNDPNLPCTQYRCKSLGQNCELVNAGSDKEQCVNVNPRDTNPPIITPNEYELTYGYDYTNVKPNPPNAGLEIVNSETEEGCVKAFEELEFGVDTDEPAQCRIDIEHKDSFDEMMNWVGGKNLYLYNHTERLILPGPDALNNGSIILENGNEMNLFIRCMDKNGNTNEADYGIRFCIDESPDNTAPQIQATSIINGGCVAADTDSADVEFYTNEPADCRWSPIDQDFDSMDNPMACTSQIYQLNALQLYTCQTTLTGVARDETDFYVRCKDQPGAPANERNENKQSYKFSLRGSTALKIKNLQPNKTIYGSVNPAPVELYVETLFGCDEGKAICYFSDTGAVNDYIAFLDTDTVDGIHTQRLDLNDGSHDYYYKCVDSGGNVAINLTSFNLDIDVNAPVVARVYEEDQMLKIVTVRDSECSYSLDNCDFGFKEGTDMPYANSTIHVTEWNEDETYFIKCRDQFKNEEADCSVIVRPTRNFL